MNKIIFIIPIITLLALIGLSTYNAVKLPEIEIISENIPDFDTTDMQTGEKVNPKDIIASYLQDNDVVMVNFFASWCSACLLEREQLINLAREHNIPIIAVAYKDNPQDVESGLAKTGNPFKHIFLDDRGHLATVWGSSGTSQSYIIDKNMKIRYHHSKPIRHDDVGSVILPVIERIINSADNNNLQEVTK